MRHTYVYPILLICSCGFISCALPEPCDYGKHKENDNCEPDRPDACGFKLINCYKITEQIRGAVDASICKYDTNENCNIENGKCVNCENVTCLTFQEEESKCTFECDASKSYYHVTISDDTSPCEQICECERDEETGELTNDDCLNNDDKIQACLNIIHCDNYDKPDAIPDETDSPDVKAPAAPVSYVNYCIKDSHDLIALKEWMEIAYHHRGGDTHTITIYMLNDKDIILNDEDITQLEPIDLDHVHLTAFGGPKYRKNIVHAGQKKLSHGLFKTVKNSVIANIGIKLDVEGDEAYGLLADTIEDSLLIDTKVSGRLINNNENVNAENKAIANELWTNFEITEKVSNVKIPGIGGVAGLISNTRLTNINLDISEVTAPSHPFVGGFAGILRHSQVTGRYIMENDKDDQSIDDNIEYHISTVSGDSLVGGLFGIMSQSAVTNYSGSVESVSATEYMGGFAGYTDEYCHIENIYHHSDSIGNNSSAKKDIGGFIGYDNAKVLNVHTTIKDVTGITTVGGFAGEKSLGTWQNINHSVDNVVGIEDYIGGMVGRLRNDIINCHNHAKSVSGNNMVGGMIGKMDLGTVSSTNTVDDYVSGNTSVGGFIGYMNDGMINGSFNDTDSNLVIDNNVNSVSGSQNVGGFVGFIKENEMINQVYSVVEEVSAPGKTGGFVGYFKSGIIVNVHSDVTKVTGKVCDIPEEDDSQNEIIKKCQEEASKVWESEKKDQKNPEDFTNAKWAFTEIVNGHSTLISPYERNVRILCGSPENAICEGKILSVHSQDRGGEEENAIGGFVGYMGEMAAILGSDRIMIEGSSVISKVTNITAHNQCVGGFAGYVNGNISNVNNIVEKKIINGYGKTAHYYQYTDYYGTGGFAGCADKKTLIQTVVSNVNTVDAAWFVGGAVGKFNGYIVGMTSRVTNVLGAHQFVGGFAGRISTFGYVSDIISKIDGTVFATLYPGGFAGETDGEVSKVKSYVNSVLADIGAGGAFGGCGGKINDFVSFVKKVGIATCTRKLTGDAAIFQLCDNMGNDCKNNSRSPFYCTLTEDGETKEFTEIWDQYLNGFYPRSASGFIDGGDGMYNGEYAAIVSRVKEVRAERANGFMGEYDFRGYNNRTATFENISSYANVYASNSTANNSLFLGKIVGITESGTSSNIQTTMFNLRNVFVMGHYYINEEEQKNNFISSIVDADPSAGIVGDIMPMMSLRYFYAYCYPGKDCTSTKSFLPNFISPKTTTDTNIEVKFDTEGIRPAVTWGAHLPSEENCNFTEDKKNQCTGNDFIKDSDTNIQFISFSVNEDEI